MCVKCNDNSCTGHCNSLPKGLRGPRGYQGEKGDKGDKGDAGLVGPQGPQGIQGLPGIGGGLGVQGTQGPIGTQGATGANGLPGANGINGTNGLPGPPGLTGPTGATGNQGEKGEVGPQGEPGVNAFKFIKEFETNFDGGTVIITRTELILCADIPTGCLAGDTLPSMVDFQIELWAMIADPIPTGPWFKVKDAEILNMSINDLTGDITIVLTGGSLGCRLRVVILG
jgi:hypothetical protein